MSEEDEECADDCKCECCFCLSSTDDCKCECCYIECEVLNPRSSTTPKDWDMCDDEDCVFCFHMRKKKGWVSISADCGNYECNVCFPMKE